MGVARDVGAHLARGERAVRREHALHRDGPAAEAAAERDGAVRAVAESPRPRAPSAARRARRAGGVGWRRRGAGAQEEKEAEEERRRRPNGGRCIAAAAAPAAAAARRRRAAQFSRRRRVDGAGIEHPRRRAAQRLVAAEEVAVIHVQADAPPRRGVARHRRDEQRARRLGEVEEEEVGRVGLRRGWRRSRRPRRRRPRARGCHPRPRRTPRAPGLAAVPSCRRAPREFLCELVARVPGAFAARRAGSSPPVSPPSRKCGTATTTSARRVRLGRRDRPSTARLPAPPADVRRRALVQEQTATAEHLGDDARPDARLGARPAAPSRAAASSTSEKFCGARGAALAQPEGREASPPGVRPTTRGAAPPPRRRRPPRRSRA